MVYFVGAGTGAVDLITVRGMRMLEQADIVIYAGSLVNPELLNYAKEGCEFHNSAKLTLDEVIEIMRQGEAAASVVLKIVKNSSIFLGYSLKIESDISLKFLTTFLYDFKS